MARVQVIMASPDYRQTGQEVAFLNQDETRGVRLQIDYLKSGCIDQGYPDCIGDVRAAVKPHEREFIHELSR